MCNLYNITTSQRAIIEWTRAMRDRAGNVPPTIDVYPNLLAPVVRNAPDGVRELAMLQWGMPTPPQHLAGKVDRGVTNIRNVNSPHWRAWLKPEARCVVALNAFAEPSPTKGQDGKTPNVWFALNEDRPLAFFAGIWTKWHGVRKVKDGPQDFELFGFLTTSPNAVVKPIHPKAMPVILTTPEEVERWLTAPAEEALRLQRPLPDAMLQIIATTPYGQLLVEPELPLNATGRPEQLPLI